MPSIEDLAQKWSIAHTIAVSAWVVVLVLAVVLMSRHTVDSYPTTEGRKIYAGENATFTYPENWTINSCHATKPFIELPGTIKVDYKGKKAYPLNIHGVTAFNCTKDRPEHFDIYSETIVASETPCSMATSTRGERLANGLYLQLQESEENVLAVTVRQNECFAPGGVAIIGFAFADPAAEQGDAAEFGMPQIKKDAFLASPQYRDIKALAESIRY